MSPYNGFTEAQRNEAQKWLNNQWDSGAMERPHTCCACGQTEGVMDAHAEDYSKPYEQGKTDQYHLCFTCHMMVHCRKREPIKWKAYKEAVLDGVRYAPHYTRNWIRFKSEMLDGAYKPRFTIYEPRDVDVLTAIEQQWSNT
jgi:hypothetical protein